MSDVAEFLFEREKGYGGSDASTILGRNPYSTALQLHRRKRMWQDDPDTVVREILDGIDEGNDPPWFWWGHEMEPLIAKRFTILSGMETRRIQGADSDTGCVWHDKISYMMAHIDYEVVDQDTGEFGIFDSKNVSVFQTSAWDDGAPVQVQDQLQHYLGIFDSRWPGKYTFGIAGVKLGGRDVVWFRYDIQRVFIDMLRLAFIAFHDNVLDDGPEPMAGASDLKMLRQDGRVMTGADQKVLPANAGEWDTTRLGLSTKMRRYKTSYDEVNAKLMQSLGTARSGILADGSAEYHWLPGKPGSGKRSFRRRSLV